MTAVKFSATKVNLQEKKGTLPVDEYGYYTMVVGGLNAFNSAGMYYQLQGAKALFEESSIFMRRVRNGALRGEVGHPRRLPGQSERDYFNRLLDIDDKNICVHFSDVWLDFDYGRNNPQYRNPELVGIMAKLKPSGPHGPALQASLENPMENVAFSIRSFTRDYRENGIYKRILDTVVTFDYVNEPGISFANKYDQPALEAILDTQFDYKLIDELLEERKDLGLESSQLLTHLKRNYALQNPLARGIELPKYLNW